MNLFGIEFSDIEFDKRGIVNIGHYGRAQEDVTCWFKSIEHEQFKPSTLRNLTYRHLPPLFISSTAIYVPLTKRYFLLSHTGLWRVCRYTIIPEPITDEALPRNFTDLSLTNQTAIDNLKRKIAREEYIEEFLSELEEPVDAITTIDEAFKRALFANWIRNTSEFPLFKARYKGILESDTLSQQSNLLAERAAAALTSPTLLESQTNGAKTITPATTSTDPAVALTANETIGGALSEVHYNGTFIKIIVPEALRNALFTYWEEKPNVLSLLLSYANDMDIPLTMTSANGKKLVIRPPPPPKDGKSHGHFKYTPHGMCFCFYDPHPPSASSSVAWRSVRSSMPGIWFIVAPFNCHCLVSRVSRRAEHNKPGGSLWMAKRTPGWLGWSLFTYIYGELNKNCKSCKVKTVPGRKLIFRRNLAREVQWGGCGWTIFLKHSPCQTHSWL